MNAVDRLIADLDAAHAGVARATEMRSDAQRVYESAIALELNALRQTRTALARALRAFTAASAEAV